MRGATLFGVFYRTIESRKGRGGVLRIRPNVGALRMLNILDHLSVVLLEPAYGLFGLSTEKLTSSVATRNPLLEKNDILFFPLTK